jgi:hypothetical protein
VRIVEGGAQHDVNSPSREPESLPPSASMPLPPQETTVDLGGPGAGELPNPSEDQKVEAMGGSIAERMRARFEAMQATAEFSVPGWEFPDGRPGLIIVARTFGDRKAYTQGLSNEAFIARSTHRLYFVGDDGERELIENGWGPKLAEIIGHPTITKATDLVSMVISKPDPSNPGTRIPNVAGIATLAMEIIAWARTGVSQAEEAMGE